MGLTAFSANRYSGCDNMAGECLRHRQAWAIQAIGFVGVLGAAFCLYAAILAHQGRFSRVRTVLLFAGLIVVTLAVVFDPAHHLNNRVTGWMA
jgi:hypothetical protein